MDIGPYISELLEELDELSLQGIGTFYKKRIPAYFDETEKAFFPPSQTIALRPDDVPTGTELVAKISQQRNLSPPSARYFVEKYAESIKSELLTAGSATIEGLGTLKNTDSGFSFESIKTIASSNEFGLAPVKEITATEHVAPIPAAAAEEEAELKSRQPEEPVEVPAPPKESIAAPITEQEAPPTPEPQAVVIQEDQKEEIYKKKRKVWPIVLIAGLLLILSFGAAIYFYNPALFDAFIHPTKGPGQKKEISPALKKRLDDSIAKAKADSIYAELEEAGREAGLEVEKVPDTLNITTNTSTVQDTLKKAPSLRYDIITASFNKKSEAENYVKIMRKKGIDAQVIEDVRRPKFKVSIGSFTDKEKADREKRRIHEELTKEAWILKTNI